MSNIGFHHLLKDWLVVVVEGTMMSKRALSLELQVFDEKARGLHGNINPCTIHSTLYSIFFLRNLATVNQQKTS
jgi:hypothetical protein